MKLMELVKILIVLAFVSLAFSGIANAQMAGGPHDLKFNDGDLTAAPAGTGQDLCRFCHTPHNSNAVAPLWDRKPPATLSFTLYSSPTMGNIMGQPTGVSQGCLSCHDGVTAFDSLLGLTGTGGNDMSTLYPSSPAILETTLANDHPVGVSVLLAGEMESIATIDPVGDAGLRLFGVGGAFVECASCHDPHTIANPFFLRLDPADGDLCEACHTK